MCGAVVRDHRFLYKSAHVADAPHVGSVGSFIVIAAGLPHYGIVEEDTVIQAHGIGPWQTTYVTRSS